MGLIDKKNVANELRSALEWCQPEDNPNGSIAVKIWAVRDALALLKEQEALEERHKALVDAADDLRAELKEANQRIWELLCEKEKLASCIYDDGK